MNQSRFNFPLLVLVLCLLAITICPLVAYSTGPQITQIAVEHAQRPQSPADLVMMSRTTAPAPSPHRGVGAAGWLAIGLVVVAAASGLLYFGSRFLRERRLANRRSRPHSGHSPIPSFPVTDVPYLPSARPAPRVPVLPDGFNFEGRNHESN